jgi:hypothetical protein
MVEPQTPHYTNGWFTQPSFLRLRGNRFAWGYAQKEVHLVLVQGAVAGGGRQDELTDKLDLGLEVVIGETVIIKGIVIVTEAGVRLGTATGTSRGTALVIVSSGGGHHPNLPAWGRSSGPFCQAQLRRRLCLADLADLGWM